MTFRPYSFSCERRIVAAPGRAIGRVVQSSGAAAMTDRMLYYIGVLSLLVTTATVVILLTM